MPLPDFSSVQSALDGAYPALERWLPKGEAGQIAARIRGKSADMTPTMMVFGVYNAGKSTFLNALMGREEAPTADKPETFKVTPYQWRGFTLLDTPGIDAPAEHEAVSRAQLEQSEVVLFVVASGGVSEELGTWAEIVKIAESGRRIMVIVNNKTGLDAEGEDFAALCGKLRSNLQQVAEGQGVENILSRVPIRLVNARAALKAKQEDKKALLEKSGLPALEAELAGFLQESSAYDVWNTCRRDLAHSFERALERLFLDATGQDGGDIKRLSQRLSGERERFEVEVATKLDSLMLLAHKNARQCFSDISDSIQLELAMKALVEGVAHEMGTELQQQAEVLGRRLGELSDEAGEILLRSVNSPVSEAVNSDCSETSDPLFDFDTIKDQAQNIRLPSKEAAKVGAEKLLKFTKERLPDLMKGKGNKWIEKMSERFGDILGKAGKYIGPAVQVVFAIKGYFDAKKAEENERLTQERHAQAVEDASRSFIGQIKTSFKQMLKEVTDEILAPFEAAFLQLENEFLAKDSSSCADRETLEMAAATLRSQH